LALTSVRQLLRNRCQYELRRSSPSGPSLLDRSTAIRPETPASTSEWLANTVERTARWGGRIRTSGWWNQNPPPPLTRSTNIPNFLALFTPLKAFGNFSGSECARQGLPHCPTGAVPQCSAVRHPQGGNSVGDGTAPGLNQNPQYPQPAKCGLNAQLTPLSWIKLARRSPSQAQRL
jgi:hypothetical protein